MTLHSNDHEKGPISTRIAISCAMKRGIPFSAGTKSMKTEIKTWSEFPKGRKATAEQILESEVRNKSKRGFK